MKQHQILGAALAMIAVFTFSGCSKQGKNRSADTSRTNAIEYGRYYAAKNGQVSGVQMPNAPKTAIDEAKHAAKRAGEKMEDAAEDANEKMRQAGEKLAGR